MVLDARRHAFIANQTGTSLSDLFTTMSLAIVTHFSRHVICLLVLGPERRSYHTAASIWIKLAIDFMCTVLPFYVALLHFLPDALPVVVALLGISSAIVIVCLETWTSTTSKKADNSRQFAATSDLYGGFFGRRIESVSHLRGTVTFFTAFSILAIDFRAMPRRHAKTEEFGWSFIDCGLSAFVCINAFVDHAARWQTPAIPWRQHALWFRRDVRDACILTIFGFIRVAMVAASGYQVHDSEYGPHWNFFFTLAVVKVAARFAFLVVPVATSLPAALAILAAWEAVLQQTSHLETLPSSSSLHGLFGLLLNFLLANKSGISSCLGFLCIYLMAAWIGQIVFTKRKSIFDCFEVAFLTALLGAVAVASVLFLPPASRRWANASYSIASIGLMAWVSGGYAVSGLVATLLRDFALSEEWLSRGNNGVLASVRVFLGPFLTSRLKERPEVSSDSEYHEPCLIDAFNRYSLAVFIGANIATGLVNLSIDTIAYSQNAGAVILLLYLLAICTALAFYYDRAFRYEQTSRRNSASCSADTTT